MVLPGLSITVEKSLTQADFNQFADLSGDNNPIHVDADFSSKTRFRRTVSHGMLLSTILRGLLDRLVPGARQVSEELMFPAPTFAEEPLSFSAEIRSQGPEYVTAAICCRRLADDVVTCDGIATLKRAEPKV